jgi:integrase
MAINKVADGKYRIDFRDVAGKRFRFFFPTSKDAKAALTDLKAKIGKGEFVAPRSIPRFREIAADWLTEKSDRRPGTVNNWKAHVSRHLLPHLGEIRLDRVSVTTIEKMRDELRKSDGEQLGLTPRSVAAVMTTCAAIFKLAIRRGYVTLNPAAMAERPFLADSEIKFAADDDASGGNMVSVRQDEVLEPVEVRKLLDESEPGLWRTLFLTAFLTGLRSGELFGLRWSDIQLAGEDNARRGKICVRRSLSWARLAGEEGAVRPKFFPPKTESGVRDVPLAAELSAALKAWKLACPPSEFDLVFPAPDGSPIHRSAALRFALRPALRRAKLRTTVTMHSLRHSFASTLIMGGASVTEVQHLLGHSNPGVTLKVYSHWFSNVETDSIDRLAQAIAQPQSPRPASIPTPRPKVVALGISEDPAKPGHFLDTPGGAQEVAADAVGA